MPHFHSHEKDEQNAQMPLFTVLNFAMALMSAGKYRRSGESVRHPRWWGWCRKDSPVVAKQVSCKSGWSCACGTQERKASFQTQCYQGTSKGVGDLPTEVSQHRVPSGFIHRNP